MQVNLLASPRNEKGLAVQFPYDKAAVDQVRMVLGLTWDKFAKVWISEGPECLLDMERFGIQPSWVSGEARVIAEEFRQQLWNVMDARVEDFHDELYGYQKQGSNVLASMPFSILADEPGTGKTKQSLDALVQKGIESGAYRRIPAQPRTNGTSPEESRQREDSGSSGQGNGQYKESLPEGRDQAKGINSYNNSHEQTGSQGASLKRAKEQQASLQIIQRERSTDESVYSENGQHTSSQGIYSRTPYQNQGRINTQNSNQLQSGLRESSENDSNRIRQEGSTYNNIQGAGQEENSGVRNFRLESNPNKTFRTLVIAPKTLCYNWIAEIALWYPELSAGVVPDEVKTIKPNPRRPELTGRIGRTDFWKNPPQIVICNYEKLLTKDWPMDLDWDVVICDEATKLKTATTATYKAVRKVFGHAKCAWCLTGTPLEIRLTELYNILCLLRPSVLGNYMRFRDQHLVTDWAGGVVGAKNINLLRERISPFMLRRTKAEVLPMLPPKLPPQNFFVKLSPAEDAAYKAFTAEFNNWLSEHGVSGGGSPMTESLRMRQFCCTPDLFTDELGKGSKFDALVELIDEWPGMVVVFSYFEEVISRLERWLGVHPEAVISGKVTTNKGERIRRAREFSEGRLGKVFLSTDAGGMGINLVGADCIVHYDQGNWNPQKKHQREDRLHRIGQINPVTVVNMMYIDTIDYGQYQLYQEEEALFKDVVEGSEEAILRKLDAPRWRRLVEGKLGVPSERS